MSGPEDELTLLKAEIRQAVSDFVDANENIVEAYRSGGAALFPVTAVAVTTATEEEADLGLAGLFSEEDDAELDALLAELDELEQELQATADQMASVRDEFDSGIAQELPLIVTAASNEVAEQMPITEDIPESATAEKEQQLLKEVSNALDAEDGAALMAIDNRPEVNLEFVSVPASEVAG